MWYAAEDPCSFDSTDLTDSCESRPVPTILTHALRAADCDQPQAIVAIKDHFVAMSTNQNRLSLAAIDIGNHQTAKLERSASGRLGFYKLLNMQTDPDGQAFAIQVKRFDDGALGMHSTGSNVLVVRSADLADIGELSLLE